MHKQYTKLDHRIIIPHSFPGGGSIEDLAWSPDSRFLASASRSGVILWRASTGEELTQWGRIGYVGSIAWSPTGENLAVGTVVYRRPASVGRVGMVRLWQFPNGSPLVETVKKKAMCNAHDPVSAVCWSPDGTRLAVPLSGGKVSVVNILDGRERFQYQTAHILSIRDIAWSPNGTWLASFGAEFIRDPNHERQIPYPVSLYNLSDGSTTKIDQGTSYLTGLSWSPDSTRLMIIGSETIKLWHVASGHLVDPYMAQVGGGRAAWSPDGQSIAIASGGRTIHICETDTGRTLSVLQANGEIGCYVNCLKWSPDGQSLAVGDSEGGVHIWPQESMIPA
jgi:WD40 repeat protein